MTEDTSPAPAPEPPPAPSADPTTSTATTAAEAAEATEAANTAPAGAPPSQTLFGTLSGVFTPTILTILGVIMYLRTGWVVGYGGLIGALGIVGLAVTITGSTGLSLSSIATNTRLKAGGPYAIISSSLGLEVGGSVGVPLYLSQALAVAMYVFGFRSGWLSIFPDHDPLIVDYGIFAVVFLLAYASTGLAFKIQYVVLACIVASLVAILGNVEVWQADHPRTWWPDFSAADGSGKPRDFWIVFAVFFPATTGIMAGANMSGELKNPRKSIPRGTLWAIALSTLVYVVLVFWCERAAEPADLIDVAQRDTLMMEKSLWAPAVIAGLLGATFSSALGSLVGAPRILMALGQDKLFPGGEAVAKLAKNGEPRRALLVSGAIVAGALMLRSLDAIAGLISMFFLIAYAVINIVMLVESSLGLVSFRPTLRVPRLFPAIGAVGCIFAMFIMEPVFGLVALGAVFALYVWILKSLRDRPKDDVRSGMFVAFAEWSATKVIEMKMDSSIRAWKPNFLVPVEDPAELRGTMRLLSDLTSPEGSIKLLGLAPAEEVGPLARRLDNQARALREREVFTTYAAVETNHYAKGLAHGLQALRSAFFRPNVLFLSTEGGVQNATRDEELVTIIAEARRLRVGVILYGHHMKAGLGREKVVNVWLRPGNPGESAEAQFQRGSMNLAVLSAYKLVQRWRGEMNLIAVVPEQSDVVAGRAYVEDLSDLCRFPKFAKTTILVGGFEDCVSRAPQSDMDIMGLQPTPDMSFCRRMVQLTGSSCLFMADSGQEDAFA